VVADGAVAEPIQAAVAAVQLVLLRVVTPDQTAGGNKRALAAAVLAEDLAPRITP
jgi:hypothetical protein